MFDIKEQYFRSFINLFDKYISVKTALTSPFPQTHSLSFLIYDCSARAGKVFMCRNLRCIPSFSLFATLPSLKASCQFDRS